MWPAIWHHGARSVEYLLSYTTLSTTRTGAGGRKRKRTGQLGTQKTDWKDGKNATLFY